MSDEKNPPRKTTVRDDFKKPWPNPAAAVKAPSPAKKVAAKNAPTKKVAPTKTTSATVVVKKAGKVADRAGEGTAKAKRTFPVAGLEECVRLVTAIKEFNAGNPWSPKEIASALKIGTGNNYFYLTASCRDYGLTVGTRESTKIELTELGRNLVYPKTPAMLAEALNTAFRAIPLFQRVYDYYQGGALPEIEYLRMVCINRPPLCSRLQGA